MPFIKTILLHVIIDATIVYIMRCDSSGEGLITAVLLSAYGCLQHNKICGTTSRENGVIAAIIHGPLACGILGFE